MRLGVHVPIAGGLLEAVARAKRLQCTTMQIFSRSPRGGPAPKVPLEVLERFDTERRAADIAPLAIHGPYIINLASPNAAMWKQSTALYEAEYARATAFQADYLVTHVGSHRGEGEAAGVARVANAVSRALDSLRSSVMILLENTAGSGQGLGYRFEQLAEIRAAVSGGDMHRRRVGICLDTAHLFAAGYAIHTEEGLAKTLAEFDQAVGREHLKLIHLNDSKVPFDSHVDRHWHIGEGCIGIDAFRRLVNHPMLREVPMVLETPKTTEAEDQRNLSTVRTLLHASTSSRGHRAVRV